MSGKWHMAILAISLVCFGLAIAMEVVMFSFFGTNNYTGESDGCELFQFFASMNLILFVFLTIFFWAPSHFFLAEIGPTFPDRLWGAFTSRSRPDSPRESTRIYYDVCAIWALARRNRRKCPDLGPGPNCEGTSDSCWACDGVRFLARAKARVARKVDTDVRKAQTTKG